MSKKKEVSQEIILDRTRYVKDSTPSMFAILAIVLDVLYFVLIYKVNKDYFYNYIIGISVIANLLFMLLAFLCSEEVKNYHGKFGYLMIGLGIFQIIRIFIIPLSAATTETLISGNMELVLGSGELIRCIIYLVSSALFMIVGGLMSIRNSKRLNNYLKSLESK